MPQYDVLVLQNTAAAGEEFAERRFTASKGFLLTGGAAGALLALAVSSNGKILACDSAEASGLKWIDAPTTHAQNTDTGTTAQSFQIHSGSSGPRIKNNSLVLEARNAADNAYADFRAKIATFDKVTVSAAPTAGSDLANKTYVDSLIGANDAMVYKGAIDCSTNPNYPAADAGHTYRVSVSGKIGGASGANVEAGDMLTCILDASPAGTHAAVGANWNIIQTNIDGAVTGPSAAINAENIPLWDSSNRVLKDSGVLMSALATVAGVANSYVAKAAFTEHSILTGNNVGQNFAVTLSANQLIGRLGSNNISNLTAAEVRTILNVETHPSQTAIDTTALSGANVISRIQVNTMGHVTSISTRAMAPSDLGALLVWVSAPTTPTSIGTPGQVARDTNNNFFYICTASNTWKRCAIATWA